MLRSPGNKDALGRRNGVGVDENSVNIFQRIRDDWKHHGRDWTHPGFRALAVYRVGVWLAQIQSGVVRAIVYRVYRSLQRYVRNHYGIELRETAQVGKRVRFAHGGTIVVHRHAVIGDDCLIRQGVTIGVSVPEKVDLAPRLGARVHVGAGAVIVGDVVIGDDVRIGPNSVVLTDVASGSTAFAPPARIIETDRSPRSVPATDDPGEQQQHAS